MPPRKARQNANTPSESAKSKEYRVYQHSSPIHDGRYGANKPVVTMAPPIQMFHPAFGYFLDYLSSNLPVPPTLRRRPLTICEPRQQFEPYLCCLPGTALSTLVYADKTSPDGMVLIDLARKICQAVATLLGEDKNELGDGGCDPSTQAGLSGVWFWVQREVGKRHFPLYPYPP
jgi:hypothetical protein